VERERREAGEAQEALPAPLDAGAYPARTPPSASQVVNWPEVARMLAAARA